MKGGDTGIKLILPNGNQDSIYYKPGIQPKELQVGEFMLVPVFQIFGSEELSSAAATLAKRIPEPFIYLNPEDGKELDLQTGEWIQLETATTKFQLKVRWEYSIKKGLAGISVGLPGMPFIEVPGKGKIYKITQNGFNGN